MNSEIPTRSPVFAQRFSPTPRGARLARLLVVEHLAHHGWPRDHELTETAALVVGELAANAVIHAAEVRADFEVRMISDALNRTLRIEVADPMGLGRVGPAQARQPAAHSGMSESGRGLRIVEAITAAWGVDPHPAGGKTVWAVIPLPVLAEALPGRA